MNNKEYWIVFNQDESRGIIFSNLQEAEKASGTTVVLGPLQNPHIKHFEISTPERTAGGRRPHSVAVITDHEAE